MDKKEIITTILGFLCLGYGIFARLAQSGTSTYLLWFILAFLLFALTAGLHMHFWTMIPVVIRRIAVVLVSLAVLVFVVVEGCIISGFFAKGSDDLDYIIVLGAQVYESGPGKVLQYRLDAACDYMEENENTICIVSGGQGSNEPCAEAQIMYEYLVEKGIDAERIIMETESLNTVENLKNSSVYIDMETDSVGIVTNNFHIFRSTRLAKALGMEHVYGIVAGMNPLYLPNNMLREFFGVLKDLLYGNLL